jgi:hypothetical protein
VLDDEEDDYVPTINVKKINDKLVRQYYSLIICIFVFIYYIMTSCKPEPVCKVGDTFKIDTSDGARLKWYSGTGNLIAYERYLWRQIYDYAIGPNKDRWGNTNHPGETKASGRDNGNEDWGKGLAELGDADASGRKNPYIHDVLQPALKYFKEKWEKEEEERRAALRVETEERQRKQWQKERKKNDEKKNKQNKEEAEYNEKIRNNIDDELKNIDTEEGDGKKKKEALLKDSEDKLERLEKIWWGVKFWKFINLIAIIDESADKNCVYFKGWGKCTQQTLNECLKAKDTTFLITLLNAMMHNKPRYPKRRGIMDRQGIIDFSDHENTYGYYINAGMMTRKQDKFGEPIGNEFYVKFTDVISLTFSGDELEGTVLMLGKKRDIIIPNQINWNEYQEGTQEAKELVTGKMSVYGNLQKVTPDDIKEFKETEFRMGIAGTEKDKMPIIENDWPIVKAGGVKYIIPPFQSMTKKKEMYEKEKVGRKDNWKNDKRIALIYNAKKYHTKKVELLKEMIKQSGGKRKRRKTKKKKTTKKKTTKKKTTKKRRKQTKRGRKKTNKKRRR